MSEVTPVFLELLGGQLANVSVTVLYEFFGKLVCFFKIVGAVEESVSPVKAEPMNVFLDGVNKFRVFLRGVSVVHSEVAESVIFLRSAEVDYQRLAVSDVEISVRFGGKTSVYCFCLAGRDIFIYKVINKV